MYLEINNVLYIILILEIIEHEQRHFIRLWDDFVFTETTFDTNTALRNT